MFWSGIRTTPDMPLAGAMTSRISSACSSTSTESSCADANAVQNGISARMNGSRSTGPPSLRASQASACGQHTMNIRCCAISFDSMPSAFALSSRSFRPRLRCAKSPTCSRESVPTPARSQRRFAERCGRREAEIDMFVEGEPPASKSERERLAVAIHLDLRCKQGRYRGIAEGGRLLSVFRRWRRDQLLALRTTASRRSGTRRRCGSRGQPTVRRSLMPLRSNNRS